MVWSTGERDMLKPGITSYTHQIEELNRLRANLFYALFAEQGTGKTLPVLMLICELLIAGVIRDAIIICPKAVIDSWYRDMEKFQPLYRRILQKRVTVINYDLVWRRPEYLRSWGCAVLDESHAIKHRTAKRSKFILKLGALAQRRYILTGTPIGNSHWDEIWAQYNFLSPDIFGKYSAFEKRYCVLNQFYKPYRYLHTDELRETVFKYAYRVLKEDCLDLPDKLPPERFTFDLLEKSLYKEMVKNYIEELDIEAKNPLARMVKLRQMCSGFIADQDGSIHALKCEKLGVLEEFIIAWEKKLVIFAEFKESLAGIHRLLTKRKIAHVVLDGDQKDKGIWRRFQAEKSLQVIVCQYKTASAGIDLFAADTILFYEPTLSSQTFEQACDRIHRPGQTSKCSYILFETKGTVEKTIWDALERHHDFNETELRAWIKESG